MRPAAGTFVRWDNSNGATCFYHIRVGSRRERIDRLLRLRFACKLTSSLTQLTVHRHPRHIICARRISIARCGRGSFLQNYTCLSSLIPIRLIVVNARLGMRLRHYLAASRARSEGKASLRSAVAHRFE